MHKDFDDPTKRVEATTTPEGAKGWADQAGSAQVLAGGHGLNVAPDASPNGVRAETRRREDRAGSEPSNAPTAARREWQDGDWIDCPRCERQTYDVGSCGLCGNLGVLDANGERFHCDCRADDWVEGDNGAIRCERCGGYAGESGTSIRIVVA